MVRETRSSHPERVIGHATTLELLHQTVSEGRVRHAYLLTGPPHVGKSTIGRWLALRLNCLQSSPPCGQCSICCRILEGAHPDVRSLQLASNQDPTLGIPIESAQHGSRTAERVISIDQIRTLQRDVALAPHQGNWKVYLITNVETMSLEAANCLLKTLEEPPASTILVLTTGDPLDVLPTVLSRCQVIRMALVPWELIARALSEDWNCPSERAQLLARLSGGRPGWAIEALKNPELLNERQQALTSLGSTLTGSIRERLQLAERLANQFSREPRSIIQILSVWQSWWWDVQLTQRRCTDLVTNVDQSAEINQFAGRLSTDAVTNYLRQIEIAAQRLLQNVNPRLVLEALLLASPVDR
ncbi:MAG TPA: DNA polymerase III subunit [Chloroflexota bacterium]|nr:DNA polymerase III subunit [Chloroflexota bacterium]